MYLWDAEQASAIALVQQAEASLSCLDAFVGPEAIALLFQTGALTAHEAGREELVARWLDAAARLTPQIPLYDPRNSGFTQRYQSVLARTLAGPAGTVSTQTAAQLDGVLLVAGIPREVPVGAHLVQYLGTTGEIQSEWISVTAETPLTIGPSLELPQPAAAPTPKPRWGLAGTGLALIGAGCGLSLYAHYTAQYVQTDQDAARTNLLEGLAVGSVGLGAATTLWATTR